MEKDASFSLIVHKDFWIFYLSNLLIMSVPDGYFRNAAVRTNFDFYVFYY